MRKHDNEITWRVGLAIVASLMITGCKDKTVNVPAPPPPQVNVSVGPAAPSTSSTSSTTGTTSTAGLTITTSSEALTKGTTVGAQIVSCWDGTKWLSTRKGVGTSTPPSDILKNLPANPAKGTCIICTLTANGWVCTKTQNGTVTSTGYTAATTGSGPTLKATDTSGTGPTSTVTPK